MLKKIIKNENREKKNTLNCVCYSHFILLNNHFDLKTNQLNAIAIQKCLFLTYASRKNLKTFKTSFVKSA